jgi:hypothetical protein
MSKRRVIFLLLFYTGTLLAGLGWYAEWRLISVRLSTFIIVGHAMQIVGLVGYMLTPDAIVRIRDDQDDF